MTTISRRLKALARDASEAVAQQCDHLNDEPTVLCLQCSAEAIQRAVTEAARVVLAEVDAGGIERVRVDLQDR